MRLLRAYRLTCFYIAVVVTVILVLEIVRAW